MEYGLIKIVELKGRYFKMVDVDNELLLLAMDSLQ